MPGRILVIRGGAIGDFILTLPAIGLLRDAFPTAHLEILGYPHILAVAQGRYANATRSIEYAPLARFFARNAEVSSELTDYFRQFNQVVSYLFDPDQIFASQLERCGVRNLITGSPKITGEIHAAHQLARPLESLALFLEDPAARVFPNAEDASAVSPRLPAGPFFALHPGSGSARKNWPLDRWMAFADWLESHTGCHLVIVGGESDRESLAKFPRSSRRNFLESLPLPQLAAALSRAEVFFGHDSGISHLAAAAGARALLLFGPTDPDIWAPRNAGVTVLRSEDLNQLELATVQSTAERVFR